jgi:hypothetical protein
MRTNRIPIAIMQRSCSDSLLTASQSDGVFGSDTHWIATGAARTVVIAMRSDAAIP